MLTEAELAVLAVPKGDRTPEQKKLAEGTNKALNVAWEEVAAAVREDPEDHARREGLKRAIHEVEVRKPPPPAKAMALVDSGPTAPEVFVLRRGDVKSRGRKVAPRPPGIVLASQSADAFPEAIEPAGTTRRRLHLASWMTRPDNPLTARVIVNRLWLHHFGRGIVATPSDFGVRGEAPSHPELLDWLASELVANDWKLKSIHRLMVTSATYRQASRMPAASMKEQARDDPENSFLWRMNRRRMDAEGLRDAMLFASGELNDKAGGPGVRAGIEKEVEDLIFTEAEVVDLWPETPDPSEWLRRSIYLFRKRNVRYPLFDAFDAPDTQTACAQRGASVHALQPLVTLNSQFAIDRARGLAARVLREEREGDRARVDHAYRIVLNRGPTEKERDEALAFLGSQADYHRRLAGRGDSAAADAWVDFAMAMLNRNEFLYVP